jgi:hypothetical protein
MNPRHHNGRNSMINFTRQMISFDFLDCLNWVRILGSDIFQLKSVKVVLKVMLCIYSILSVLQIYFFASSPSMAKVFSCGAAFFQICTSSSTEEDLMYDDSYQEEINAKLKIIIDRHCNYIP